MRIVQVANFYGPRSGGLRTTMHALGAGYRAEGHESVLVVPGTQPAAEQTPYGTRITVPSRGVPATGGYRVITDGRAMRRLLDDLAPDRLEVSDRTTLRGLGEWARSRGVPAVMWAHERVDGVLASALPWGDVAANRAVADRWNAAAARSFDRVVCTTGFAAAEFTRIGAQTVERVPLGVDLRRFDPANASAAVRHRHASGDEVLLVLCSRLSREKRPDLALATLRSLLVAGVPARLVVAGTGPLEQPLRRAAAGLPVTMLGFVTDRSAVAALLASADVALAPGPIETFGLAALESLASGTPVVASSTSALPEVIGPDPQVGAWAAPDGAALAEAVRRVLSRPREAREAAARARAEAFPWAATVERMLALHRSLGSPGSPAAGRASTGAARALPRARAAALVRASYARTLPEPATRPPAGHGPSVVALGDSVTLGVGDLVEPGQRPGWAAHAAHALDASRFVNLATLGARAHTVVDDQLDRALEVGPDLVLVSAGGNDVLRGDLDAGRVAEATSRYVGALTAEGCVVVLARLPVGDHVTWLPRRLARVLRARIARVNAALESVSERYQVPLVSLPAQAPAPTESLWHVDRIHPGPAGHRLLAGGALRAVAPLGLVAATDVPAVTVAPPGAASQMGWLVRNGAPWVVKRSVDLAPALGRQLLSA